MTLALQGRQIWLFVGAICVHALSSQRRFDDTTQLLVPGSLGLSFQPDQIKRRHKRLAQADLAGQSALHMSGEKDLQTLLNTMTAVLHSGIYVFATLDDCGDEIKRHARMVFEETEGTTLILRQDVAESFAIKAEFPCRMITLNVHSSLEAVGFIARVATALAQEGMGVNPVSGFYHDHLFVPVGCEDVAMRVISDLSATASQSL